MNHYCFWVLAYNVSLHKVFIIVGQLNFSRFTLAKSQLIGKVIFFFYWQSFLKYWVALNLQKWNFCLSLEDSLNLIIFHLSVGRYQNLSRKDLAVGEYLKHFTWKLHSKHGYLHGWKLNLNMELLSKFNAWIISSNVWL